MNSIITDDLLWRTICAHYLVTARVRADDLILNATTGTRYTMYIALRLSFVELPALSWHTHCTLAYNFEFRPPWRCTHLKFVHVPC